MSPWYEKGLIRRKKLVIIMMYSQMARYLKGGGIIPVNVDMLGSVSIYLSVCTI